MINLFHKDTDIHFETHLQLVTYLVEMINSGSVGLDEKVDGRKFLSMYIFDK